MLPGSGPQGFIEPTPPARAPSSGDEHEREQTRATTEATLVPCSAASVDRSPGEGAEKEVAKADGYQMRFVDSSSTPELLQNAPVGTRFAMIPAYRVEEGGKLEVVVWIIINIAELQALDALA